MRIGFDISDLATNRADGTTRYTREMAKRLPVIGRQHEWLMFCPYLDSGIEQELKRSNVKVIRSPWPKYWTQSRLPWEIYRWRPEALFMPIQQLPIIRPKRLRTIAVVHDLAVHKFPRQFTFKDWLLLHYFSAQACREATSIIAVSGASARDIAAYYGRTDAVVIGHGVDKEKFRPPASREEREAAVVLVSQRLEINQPYILYVGQIQPRKNIVRLIKAFDLLARERNYQLVLAGGHGWLRQTIDEAINQAAAKERIHRLEGVNDTLLRALYWQAEVFVLPSLYEGFGMPVLEAMSCGCPVVTSNNSSLPEVAGGAAILVEATDVNSIKSGIVAAVERREELIKKGRERVSNISWENTAKQTLAIIEDS